MSSSRLLPPSDASRPRSGILTPSSDGSLNRDVLGGMGGEEEGEDGENGLRHARKRRRRGSHAMEDLLRPTIILKPHPTNLAAKPRVLQPLMVLPREHLPLSFLDLALPHGDLPNSLQLYESQIRILDLESRRGLGPVLLVARNEATGYVYALEASGKTPAQAQAPAQALYAVCKLADWVDLLALSAHATLAGRHMLRVKEALGQEETGAQPPTTTASRLHGASREKKAAIAAIQSMVRKRAPSVLGDGVADVPQQQQQQLQHRRTGSSSIVHSRAQTPAVPDDGRIHQEAPMQAPDQPPGEAAQVAEQEQKSASGIFDSIRTHYSEALYRSMGSLAYFAKGPLSRARAAFHLDCDSTLNMEDLIDFLKSLVMTTVQIDTKYRQAVPDLIANMKTIVDSSDEEKKRKKRKLKKTKLGKDGLYPMEDEHIRRWWTSKKTELQDEEGTISQQQIRSHLDLLRTRETQLQVILILEIMALEPLRAAEEEGDSQLPGLPGTSLSPAAMPPPPKKRNKHNLPVLADVHADRLCIWHSTASDELRLLEDSQGTSQMQDGQQAKKASSEPLRDFCIDIITPFFSPRLPELCDAINRKLGGPIIVSPPKTKHSKTQEPGKETTKPGAPVKRPGSSKPKTLQRALSNEQNSRRSVSRGPSNAIALLRSATSTTIPGLKREGSEPLSLKSMAKAEPGLAERPGLLSRSSSFAAPDETKSKKRAIVDAELKDAISALRKPNRELAGKALADAAERRTSGSLSSLKKSKKPTRNPLFQAVQVKATPVNNRFRDALAAAPKPVFGGGNSLGLPRLLADDDFVVPPSSASVIPSTAPRRGHRDAVAEPSSGTITSTPLRKSSSSVAGPSALLQVKGELPIPPSSPLMARNASTSSSSAAQLLGLRKARRQVLDARTATLNPAAVAADDSDTGGGPRAETPVKPRVGKLEVMDDENTVMATPVRTSYVDAANNADGGRRQSIYQRLGWDDDDLDD